jgi:hypothetical protein
MSVVLNICIATIEIYAMVLQKFWEKEHLVKCPLISNQNKAVGTFLHGPTKPLFTIGWRSAERIFPPFSSMLLYEV